MDIIAKIPGNALVGGPVFLTAGLAGGFATYYFEDYLFGSMQRRKFVAVAAGFVFGIGAAHLVTRSGSL